MTSKALTIAERFAQSARERQAAKARQEVEERNAARSARLKADLDSLQQPLNVRLPILADPNTYPLPNSFARSALFAAVKDSDRAVLREVSVFALGNYQIRYTGDQLNQSDLDVFMAVLCESYDQPLGATIYFNGYGLLKRMNWSTNSISYQRLLASLKRLQRAQVEVEYTRGPDGDRTKVLYVGSFLKNFTEVDARKTIEGGEALKSTRWVVELDQKLSELFVNEDTTIGLWSIRKKIDGRQPLAQHLLSFYQTHENPIPMACEFFKQLVGGTDANETNFVYRLEAALDKLVAIGFLKAWWYKDEDKARLAIKRKVHVERIPPKVLGERARIEIRRRKRGSSQFEMSYDG